MDRLRILFERYGTRAEEIAQFLAAGDDQPLQSCQSYSRREIAFILRAEKVMRLDDLILRRTLIAMLGQLSRGLLEELAAICAGSLGWSDERKAREIRRTLDLLRDKHRVTL